MKHSIPIAEFVGLKPKLYSYITDEIKIGLMYDEEGNVNINFSVKGDKKAKGSQKVVVKNDVYHNNFMNILFEPNTTNKGILKKLQHNIRSYKHELYSITQEKIVLSGVDSKRWIKSDGITSYAHGHKAISN